MALIFEHDKQVAKKKIPIPNELKKELIQNKELYKRYLDANLKGSKICKSLGSVKRYNNKGVNSKSNGDEIKQDSVDVNKAAVRLHRMNKLPKNSIEYLLNGGEKVAKFYRDGINRAKATQQVDKVKPPKPTTATVKPSDVSRNNSNVSNGGIPRIAANEGRVIIEHTKNSESKKKSMKKIYISENKILTIKNTISYGK